MLLHNLLVLCDACKIHHFIPFHKYLIVLVKLIDLLLIQYNIQCFQSIFQHTFHTIPPHQTFHASPRRSQLSFQNSREFPTSFSKQQGIPYILFEATGNFLHPFQSNREFPTSPDRLTIQKYPPAILPISWMPVRSKPGDIPSVSARLQYEGFSPYHNLYHPESSYSQVS